MIRLILVVISVSLLKFYLSISLPQFDYHNDSGLFQAEAAYHYKYAKLIAEGKDLSMFNIAAQYPEGLDIHKEYPILSEYLIGYSYKFVQNLFYIPFHVYLLLITSAFSSLSIISFFYIGNLIISNRKLALIFSIFYGLSLSSIDRNIGWYGHEDFALPFLFLSTIFLINPNIKNALIATISLILALSLWHLTSLFIIIYASLILMLSLYIWNSTSKLIISMSIIFIFLSVYSLIHPMLNHKQYLFSPGSVIFFLAFITIPLKKYIKNKYLILSVLIVVLGFIFTYLSKNHGSIRFYHDFSHVFELTKYKIIMLLNKDSDVYILPPIIHLYWYGPYYSPSLSKTISWYILPMIFVSTLITSSLLLSLNKFIKRETFIKTYLNLKKLFTNGIKHDANKFKIEYKQKIGKKFKKEHLIILTLTIIFILLYVFFQRFRVFLSFYLWLYILILINKKYSVSLFYKKLPLFFFVTFVCQIFTLFLLYKPVIQIDFLTLKIASKIKNQKNDEYLVAQWIRNNTSSNAVFFSSQFSFGSYLFAYTDRKVTINSQFESSNSRVVLLEQINALFSSKEHFINVMKKYGVTHIVLFHQDILNENKDSYRNAFRINNLYKHSVADMILNGSLHSPLVEKYRTKTISVYELI